MGEKCGQNLLFMGAVEATYGTINKTIELKAGCKFSFTEVIPEMPVPRNTGQVETSTMEASKDMSYVDGTIEGVLTRSMLVFLLELLTGDAEAGTSGDVWTHNNACARPGASLYLYTDIGTLETTTDDVYDVVTGAIITQLVLNFQQGSPVTFSATVKAKAVSREITNADTNALVLTAVGADASFPADGIAKYSDLTVALGGASAAEIAYFNGGTLTLTNELAGDDILFQNSDTIINPVILRTGGNLTASWIYDTAKDPTIYDNIQGTGTTDSITLLFGTVWQYTFVIYGVYESYERPPVDRGKVLSSFNKKIERGTSTASLTVTYTDLTPEG